MNIKLCDKYDTEKVNNNELYREILVYKVNDKTSYMMSVIEEDGMARAYNIDSDAYFNYENQSDYSDIIPNNILNELENLAIQQIKNDYKIYKVMTA